MNRKAVSLLAAFALLLGSFSLLGSGWTAAAEEQEEKGKTAPVCDTEEETENGLRRVRMVYEDISPEQLQEILEGYETRGLRLLSSTAEGWSKILYGDGLWVEISANTKSHRKCVITETWGRRTQDEHALSGEEARILLPVEATHLLERTPEGLYEATGAQVFCVLVDHPPREDIADPLYPTGTWLVGKQLAIPLYYCYDGNHLLCGDVDGDGAEEIVLQGYGPTSGIYTETLSVYGVTDGIPWLKGSSFYWMDWGETALLFREEGEICFSYGRRRYTNKGEADGFETARVYPVRLRNGRVELEGAPKEDFARWGTPYYALPDLPPETVLELTIWEEGEELLGFLCNAEDRERSLSEWNAMIPWPAEALAQALAENRERPLRVYRTERPAREAPVELQGRERDAVLQRLGLD